jgi:hypothetical protein
VFTTLEDIPEVDGVSIYLFCHNCDRTEVTIFSIVTEMTPTSTGDTFIHSFWTDEDDDYQL